MSITLTMKDYLGKRNGKKSKEWFLDILTYLVTEHENLSHRAAGPWKPCLHLRAKEKKKMICDIKICDM